MKYALIGCGRIAVNHIKAALNNELEIVAVCDLLPEAMENSEPSWFGFLLTVREGAGFRRDDIVAHLEEKNIQTRMLFAGNLVRHPCFDEMRAEGRGYRVVGTLENTDRIMKDSFWIGVYPGMTEEKLRYMSEQLHAFVSLQGKK